MISINSKYSSLLCIASFTILAFLPRSQTDYSPGVCNMAALLQEFKNACLSQDDISYWKQSDRIFCIERTQCPQFRQDIPKSLVVNLKWDSPSRYFQKLFSQKRTRIKRHADSQPLQNQFQPRYRQQSRIRNRRQIRMGYPRKDIFTDVIARLPERSAHKYVALGETFTLRCLPPDEDIPYGLRSFSWTRSDGRTVSGVETFVDKTTGDLTITAVQLHDADVYTCHIDDSASHMGEEGAPEIKPELISRSQQMDVVAEPILWVRWAMLYKSSKCDHDELDQIKKDLPKSIHHFICPFCVVRNVTATCVRRGQSLEDGEQEKEHDIKINFAFSSLNLEKEIQEAHHGTCEISCLETLHKRVLEFSRDSVIFLFDRDFNVYNQYGPTNEATVYTPQIGTMEMELIVTCPSGFFDNYKLCFPCPAGLYSPTGNTICFSCPIGQFQPTPGSGHCLICPEGYSTLSGGSVAEFDCKSDTLVGAVQTVKNRQLWIILGIIGLVLLFLLFLICCIPCMCPKSKLGRCCAPCSCCGPNPDEEDEFEEPAKNKLLDEGQTGESSDDGQSCSLG